MEKTFIICSLVALSVFSVLFFCNHDTTKIVPYYVQSPSVIAPHSLSQNIPTIEQIKKDLSGKTITINGTNHTFVGPEINEVSITKTTVSDSDNISLDVKICADSTIVHVRRGLLFRRRHYSHENVCGSLKVYYKKNKEQKWEYRMAENVDLKKTIKLNSVAPSTKSTFWKYDY